MPGLSGVHHPGTLFDVIRSFKESRTEASAHGTALKGIPADVLKRAVNKLFLLQTVTRLEDLPVPPGNRLEALSGDRRGPHSIRVNDQWRICFVWSDDGANDVELVDYHEERPVTRDIPVPHPGTILREEFLEPMGLPANIALCLGRYLGVDPQWFMNMQASYDLQRQGEALATELAAIAVRGETGDRGSDGPASRDRP